MPPAKFKSQLEASSYHAPGGGEAYKPLRENIIRLAVEQGYDEPSMVEHGVIWADDQDPWGHIRNHGFNHFASVCNFRLFESFEAQLGDKIWDLLKIRGIGVMVKSIILDMKRPVSYPDSLIIANRVDNVKADRYHVTTTMWSLRQQAPVAETKGWVVFFDYKTGKPADLVQTGGVYADLNAVLVEKSKAANEKVAAWEKAHPKKSRGPKL